MIANSLQQKPPSHRETIKPGFRPRVLFVASTRHSGGLEVASVRLADMLMRTQPLAQEIIFACKPGQYTDVNCRENGIPTVGYRLANSADLIGTARLASIIVDNQVDIVHVHSRRDFVAAALAVSKVRMMHPKSTLKLIFHMHLLRDLGAPALTSGIFFNKCVDRFIAVSETVREFLLKTHPILKAESVAVVPNGIEFDKFSRSAAFGAHVRAEYSIRASQFVFGMVGRLDTKGQMAAINALAKLKAPSCTLLLVGESGKRGYLKKLKDKAANLGVEDRVIFCGAKHDIAPYLSAMDAFVHLPTDEAFGLAPAEAMSAGLPVIVSNRGGCIELVSDHVDGLVVDPEDVDAITSAMAEILQDHDQRTGIASRGTVSVRRRYSTSAQASAITSVYDQLLCSPQ